MLEWVSAGRTTHLREQAAGTGCGSVLGENGRGSGSQGRASGLRPGAGAGRPPGGPRKGVFKHRGGSEIGEVSLEKGTSTVPGGFLKEVIPAGQARVNSRNGSLLLAFPFSAGLLCF